METRYFPEISCLASIVFLAGMTALGQAPQYTVHDLGPLPGTSDFGVTAIKNSGQVVGYSITPGGTTHGFRTAPNSAIDWTMDDLGTLGGTISRAFGINDYGQVVGVSIT